MNRCVVRTNIEALLVADPDVADRDEVAAIVRTSRQMQSWLDAINVKCARRTRALAAEGRSEPAESLLGDQGHRSTKDSAAVGDRERVCDAMAGFEDALESGTVSAGHLDAIANATRRLEGEARDEFCLHEQQLLAAAGQERIEKFERTCSELARFLAEQHDANAETEVLERQRAASKIKRWVDKITGMHHTHVELDPVRDAKLKATLDAQLRRVRKRNGNSGTPWTQLEIEAFMNMVAAGVKRSAHAVGGDTGSCDTGSCDTGSCDTGDGDSDSDPDGDGHGDGDSHGHGHGDGDSHGHRDGDSETGPKPRAKPAAADEPSAEMRIPEIGVLVSLEWLMNEAHLNGICETYDGIAVPISTVRRLCCDAEIIPYILNGNGEVVDMGRSTRTINRAQRRKLRAMHRTCGHPECAVRFEACHIHHIRFWTRDHGPTNIDNLLPLCEKHHHLVHEGRWTLTMTPDRVATWSRPDGTVHTTQRTIDRAPNGIGPTATVTATASTRPTHTGQASGNHQSTRPPGTQVA